MKHIQVDRDIATKYQHYLRAMASQVAQKVGIVGPKSDIEARRSEAKIQEYFSKHMNMVLEKMYEERGKAQQAVDNIDEYTAVQNSCKKGGRRR
jgi:signal recognition particle receptor subunit beta